MINITNEKRRILHIIAQRECGLKDPNFCDKNRCTCSLTAEYLAKRNSILPEGYQRFLVSDFTGQVDEGLFLDDLSAVNAKKQVYEYCFGDHSLDSLNSMTQLQLNEISNIPERFVNGNNIVIHGDSTRILKPSSEGKNRVVIEQPLGRTFIASIITHEAIRCTLDAEYYKKHIEWVDFSTIAKSLKGTTEEERVSCHHYEECDWLVIDDITDNILSSSPAQKAWFEPILNSFFSSRYKNKLITVFVFRFDINRRRSELESAFGVTVAKIIDDSKSFVIGLTSDERSGDAQRS